MKRAVLFPTVVIVVLVGVVAGCGPSRGPSPEPAPAPRTPVREPATAAPARASDPFALARGYQAPDPGELARRLVVAERAIRFSSTRAAALVEHGRVQQAAYRQLVVESSWSDHALEAVPDDLRDVVRANVQAGAELRALTAPREALPDWRIVAPPPAAELRGHYEDGEAQFGIPWYYLAAIHLVETRMGRIRGTSTAGARGPMQFLPPTWARWGSGDIEDARDSILAAARFLRGHGAPADMGRALYRYNPSQRYVRAITLYAEQMRLQARAFLGYHAWQVYYRTTQGDAILYEGWPGQPLG